MTSAEYDLSIDLDGDGLFGGTGEDATGDVVTVSGAGTLFASDRGRDQVRLLAPPREIGRAHV